jgi:hypothetical protein
MAQPSNFAIPATFSFRPYRARWVVCRAEIVGWRAERIPPLGFNVTPVFAPVPRAEPTALELEIARHRSRGKILVSVAVPSLKDGETEPSVGAMLSAPPYAVEMYCDEIPADVLSPHENRENTPDIAGREFYLLACVLPEFAEIFPKPIPGDVAKNAWSMRAEFFGLEEDSYAIVTFLNRWGLWNTGRGYITGLGYPTFPFSLVFPQYLWEKRERYLSALAGTARAWLSSALPLTFSRIDKPPYFLVERFYCEDAIQATITIDHLSDVKFGICKRNDCRKLFQRVTQQKRLYCSPECAHLANVRKLRNKKKKAESKGRKHATRKN